MEKLLIYFLLSGKLPPTAIKLEQLTNPLAFKIAQQILRSTKRGKIPTVNDLHKLFKASEGKSEALKLSAYLDAVGKSDTSLAPEEVVSSIETTYLLEGTESKLTEVAELAIAKDIAGLREATRELAVTAASIAAPKATKLGEDIPNNIFMLESSLPTFNKYGARLAGVTIIGAPSGVGKSAFSTQEVIHKFYNGVSSVYFSLELPAKLLEARVLAHMAEVHLGDILKDLLPDDIRVPLSAENQKKLNKVRAVLGDPKTPDITIYDNIFDVNTIEGKIREHAANGVRLFVIDYLNLISFKTANGDPSGWSSKAKFVITLNQLCLELGIVIVLPTQIDIEKSTDGKLIMKTRGTTELLNTSSLALLLYRPPDSDKMLTISAVKSRNSEGLQVALADELQFQRLADLGRI